MADERLGRQVSRYQRLLVAYPRPHRQAYGPAMVQLFSDRLHEEHANRARFGRFSFWISMLFDLVRSALTERMEATMKGFKRANWWLAIAGALAAIELAVVGAVWWDRATPETVTLFEGETVRLPSDNGPLVGELLFSAVVVLAAAALIRGIVLRSRDPHRGRTLMLAGLIPAAVSGIIFFWAWPFWITSALAFIVLVQLIRQPAAVPALGE